MPTWRFFGAAGLPRQVASRGKSRFI